MKRKKKDDSAENWSYKNDYPIEEVWNTDNYLAGVIRIAEADYNIQR